MPYGNKKKICRGVLHVSEAGFCLAVVGSRTDFRIIAESAFRQRRGIGLDLPDAAGVGGADIKRGH